MPNPTGPIRIDTPDQSLVESARMDDVYGPIRKLSLRSIVARKEPSKALPLPPIDSLASLASASCQIACPDLDLERRLLSEATKAKAASSPPFHEQEAPDAAGMFDSDDKHDFYFALLEVTRQMKGISQADVVKAVFLFIREEKGEQRVQRAEEYLGKLEALKEMGFEAEDASQALIKCSLKQEEAVDWMLNQR